MRPRDLDTLAATTFDLLVIGGGIHGLAIAYDAASRGLRTALVEAGDFGSGASFNHQKTVHGGLRSLQYGRVPIRAAVDPRAPGAGAHRAVDAASAAVPGRHLPLGHAQPPGASRRVQARRVARRAIAMPASSRSCTCRRRAWCRRRSTLRLFPGVRAGEAHRRRAVVRLPDGRSRSSDVRVCGRGRSRRRASRQLRRGRAAAPRRLADRRHAGARHAHRPGPLDPRRRDGQRRRAAGRRDHDGVRREARRTRSSRR